MQTISVLYRDGGWYGTERIVVTSQAEQPPSTNHHDCLTEGALRASL